MITSEAMAKVFKAVGTVAGISGIALAVLWSIYGEVINDQLLSKVPPSISGVLIASIITFTFLIAIVALFVGFFKPNQIKPIWFIILIFILLLFIICVIALFKIFPNRMQTEESLALKGYRLLELGDIDEAERTFDEYFKKNKNIAVSLYWKARISLKRGNKNIALQYLGTALKNDPNHIDSIILKIKLLLLIGGKNDEAKLFAMSKKHIDEINPWIKCLANDHFFSKDINTETELESKCSAPNYHWK